MGHAMKILNDCYGWSPAFLHICPTALLGEDSALGDLVTVNSLKC